MNEAVNEGKRLCENTKPPGMTWVASRLFRVRARLAAQSGFENDRMQFEETARKYEESLGLPAAPFRAATLYSHRKGVAARLERAGALLFR